MLVATCVAVTTTLGTTARVVSVTAPVMVAKVDCAGKGMAQRSRLNALSIPDGRASGITLSYCNQPTVSCTLKQVAAAPRHLGAEVGFTAVLHTWGQNILFHPPPLGPLLAALCARCL